MIGMAIRIRKVDGHNVAICAARSHPKEGDIYLDDGVHYSLSQKFWHDYKDHDMPVDEEDRARRVQEEDNLEEWDRHYGEYAQRNKVGVFAEEGDVDSFHNP